MAVVAVHTLEEDALAVDIYQRTAYFDVAETIFGREGHFVLASSTLDNAHRIEVRCFCCPQAEVLHAEVSLNLAGCFTFRETHGLFGFSHYLARRIRQTDNKFLFAFQTSPVVERQFHLHFSLTVISRSIQTGSNVMIAHAHQRCVVEINIAENTAHTEHVLTFQVRAVAPAEHLYGQFVLSRTEI